MTLEVNWIFIIGKLPLLDKLNFKVLNYICCPNGFGHFKRFVYLNKLFDKSNIKVNLYTNSDAWIKFANFNNVLFSNITIKNYNFPSYFENKNKTLLFFREMLKKIDNNLIICDNYEEVCFLRNKIILIANFFWNISSNDKNYLDKLNKNILKNNCFLYGNKYFSADYIKNIINYKGIGFFGNKKSLDKKIKIKNKILFVKGFGSYKKNFEQDLLMIYNNLKKNHELIFDSNIDFAKNYGFKTANKFDEQLFSELKLIVGRPSFGILTDAIARNIPFYPLSDKNDLESIDTKFQINNIFGTNNNIERYISESTTIYKKHKFKFKAENDLFKTILGLLNEA